jgi:putative chitinase
MVARQIDTHLRRAHFLAQVGCESGELRFMEEIASGQDYEGRRDLGNTQPGDGQRFKGRGLIQLTGRANYTEYGRALGREAEVLAYPELVATDKALCADLAGWYWAKRELNALADRDDLTAVTRRVNGGLNGLEERRRLLQRAKALLGA